MDSIERGMNPVTMTIINPQKEYWPSPGSIDPVTSYSKIFYATDRGLAYNHLKEVKNIKEKGALSPLSTMFPSSSQLITVKLKITHIMVLHLSHIYCPQMLKFVAE